MYMRVTSGGWRHRTTAKHSHVTKEKKKKKGSLCTVVVYKSVFSLNYTVKPNFDYTCDGHLKLFLTLKSSLGQLHNNWVQVQNPAFSHFPKLSYFATTKKELR